MAQMASAEAHRRLDATDKLLAGTFDAAAAAAGSQALFGDGFWMVPALTPPAKPDLFSRSLAGAGVVSPARGAIRRFIRDIASVRDAVERFSESLLFGDALGLRANLRVAQLATPDTPGVNRWIGGTLDLAQPTPDKPVANIFFKHRLTTMARPLNPRSSSISGSISCRTVQNARTAMSRRTTIGASPGSP